VLVGEAGAVVVTARVVVVGVADVLVVVVDIVVAPAVFVDDVVTVRVVGVAGAVVVTACVVVVREADVLVVIVVTAPVVVFGGVGVVACAGGAVVVTGAFVVRGTVVSGDELDVVTTGEVDTGADIGGVVAVCVPVA
jgi:hypothetical protein